MRLPFRLLATFLVLTLTGQPSIAQTTQLFSADEFIYGSYAMNENSPSQGPFRIAIRDNRDVVIEVIHVVDMYYSFAALVLKQQDHAKFILAMSQAKQKYIEWSKAASDNHVTSMEKMMEIDCPNMDVIWNDAIGARAGAVHFHERNTGKSVRLIFKFMVSKGAAALVILSGPVTSTKGAASKGIALRFEDVQHLNQFIAAISLERARLGLAEKRRLEGAFK